MKNKRWEIVVPFDFVEIIWQDACMEVGWEAIKELKPVTALCCSRGWLIKEDADTIILAACYSPFTEKEDETNVHSHIPKGMVRHTTVLVKKPK